MNLKRSIPRINISRDSEPGDVCGAARFDKNGLPNPARRRVPAPLFADGLLGIIHRVLDPQDDQRSAFTVERVGQIKFKRGITAFVRSEVPPVAPAVREKIGRSDVENHPLALPRLVSRDFHPAAVPTDFIARRGAMVSAGHFQGMSEDAGGIIIIAPRGIPFAPGGEGFPAKGHDDLLAPIALVRLEPLFVHAAAVTVEAELPRAIEVEPVVTLDRAALKVGPGVFGPGIKK